MDTYEKKYKEALLKARDARQITESAVTIGILEEIFPELKESEDEKIREKLIKLLNDLWAEKQGLMTNRKDYERYVSWLEKQGEKSQRMISAEAKEAMYDKPAWSEADEDLLTSIEDSLSDYLGYTEKDGTLTPHSKGIVKLRVVGYIDWIKSLKQRIGG